MLVVLLLLLVIKFRFMSGGLLDPAIANNPDFPATSPTCSIVSSFVLSGAMGRATESKCKLTPMAAATLGNSRIAPGTTSVATISGQFFSS
ncbi:hypothetical protein ACFX13_007485 [Malus domestica]